MYKEQIKPKNYTPKIIHQYLHVRYISIYMYVHIRLLYSHIFGNIYVPHTSDFSSYIYKTELF